MSFEIPKTRSEKILQNILGAKNEIEPIQSRIEAILFAILNDTEIGDPYTAPARCEIEKLLVAIKDGGEYNETPLTRSGRILLCKLRGEDYTGITQSRLEKLFLRWLYELMEITDVPPFTFKSKGNNLIDYDIYGAEDGVGDNEDKTVSGNPISVSDAVEAPATSLQVSFTPSQASTPWIDSEPTTEPYLSKSIPRGNREYYSLVGATVAWNQLVQNGASDVNESGVMNIPWADGNNNYVMPMNLCHIETVEDTENNSIQVADFESHYVLPFDCVFDAAEAIIAGDTDLAAGDYYFKIVNDSWGNNNGKYVLFTLDADLVAGQQIRKKSGAFNAAIEDCTLGIYTSGSDRTGTALAFTVQTTQPESGTNLGQTDGTGWCNFWHCVVLGYNRWKYSAVRQFLNSDATAGNWWTQQHKWDVMPTYATTKNGFLYGITAGVKEHLKETKVYTARNTVFNGGDTPLGGMDETLDKVFLVALEQSWIEPQESGEGTYWEYYKNLLGTNTPVARSQTYPLLIKYDLAAKTTARARWMRSCNRGGAYIEWTVNSSGNVPYVTATLGIRVAPCLRIATSDLENYKIPSNHKYLLKYGSNYSLGIGTGECVNILKNTNDYVTDLTLLFANAPEIADYAYSLEQSEAGSGIAWLKSYGFFTNDYYPYNSGGLISVKTSGHKVGSTTYPLSDTELRGLFKLDVNNKLYAEGDLYPPSGSGTRKYGIVDLGTLTYTKSQSGLFQATLPLSTARSTLQIANIVCAKYVAMPSQDITGPQGANPSPNMVMALNMSHTIYFNNTSYTEPSDFKTAMSGVYLVYELKTPTTESLTPYTSPIVVEQGGTEEFIDDRTVPVPVGNETYYAAEYAVEGKTGATVTRAGKNLFNKDAPMTTGKYLNSRGQEVSNNSYSITDFIPVKPNTTYFWAINGVPSGSVPNHNAPRVGFYDSDKNWVVSGDVLFNNGSKYTTPSNVRYARLSVYGTYINSEMFIESEVIPTEYSPYQGITYTATFTQQGTVYGGTVDIVSGVLTVTWAILSNPQNLNWISNSSQGMKNFQTDRGTVSKKSGSNNWKCSRYSNGFIGTDKAEGIFIFDSGEVCIRDYRYWEHGGIPSEVAAFKASLADVTIAYELAEPQTYQLTPQQVQMLLNDNYLTTEDGTITLTYKGPGINVPFSVSCDGESNSYNVELSDKLYKVSAYADSISYDDQTVKREIIVKKLDGSEEWDLNDGIFSTTLSERARIPAVLCNELTSEQCYIESDLTTLNVTGVPQTSVEEFVAWLQASDVYVQYVRENTLVTSHAVPEVSTFNGTNTFSVDTEVTPSEVTIIYPNRVTTRALPKTKKIGKSKLTKSK